MGSDSITTMENEGIIRMLRGDTIKMKSDDTTIKMKSTDIMRMESEGTIRILKGWRVTVV